MAKHELKKSAVGHFKESLGRQFLPGCRNCGHKHPKAYMPPLETNRCPRCGVPSEPPGRYILEDAVHTDGIKIPLVARLLLRAGKYLKGLSERVGR